MGEYAYFNGQRVKIGTCEDMLYLRWDQRSLVERSETPLFDPDVLKVIRFRFPFPDEDHLAPGAFDNPFRGYRLDGFEAPTGIDHGNAQFIADNGYLMNLPCPESQPTILANGEAVKTHLNGYGGSASLVGQALRDGRLVGIARCNGCRTLYRLEDGYEEAAAVAIRAAADRLTRTADLNLQRGQPTEGDRANGRRLHLIADRLLAGYQVTVGATS
jgi:hypothetical protein